MNKYRKLASNSILFAISGFSSKVLSFFLIPLYASYLSTEEFGIADIVITTVNVLFPVLSLSLADAILRLLYDTKYKSKDLLRNAFTEMYISVAFLLVILILNHFILRLVETKYCLYGIGLYLFNYCTSILNNYLKANDKVRALTWVGIVNTFITLLLALLLIVVLRAGLDGYLLSLVISSIIGNIVLIYFCKLPISYLYPAINKSVMKDMLKFSIPIIPSTIAWWINTSVDKYMITAMISTSANGLYSMAHKIPSILTVIASFFGSAWQLSVIDNINSSDNKQFITLMYEAYCFVCFIICTLGITISKGISIIFLKGDFIEGYIIMPILFVATVFSSINGFLGSISIAQKNTKNLAKSTILGAIINVTFNFFLIRYVGITGAAIATAFSFMIIAIIRIKPFLYDGTIKKSAIIKSVIISIIIFICAIVSAVFNSLMIPIGIGTMIVTAFSYQKISKKIIKIIPIKRRK